MCVGCGVKTLIYFKDSVAVVTGGTNGIGFALAKAALLKGAKVVIADIREYAVADAAVERFGKVKS